MTSMHRTALGLILCCTLGLTTSAQGVRNTTRAQGKKPPGVKPPAVLTPEQQSALLMLDQLFKAAEGLDDFILKIRTQARIADTLWPYDKPRARLQFEESFRAAMSVKYAPPNGLATSGSSFAQTSPLSGLQSEILALIARRDTDLAERLIKSVTSASPDKEARTTAQTGEEEKARHDLYLQAALGIAESNPGRAAELAKAGLGGEINPEILKVLFALRSSNPAAADNLFRAALAVARRDGRRTSINVATLAPYILPEFMLVGAGISPTQETGATASPLVREFLDFTYDTFLQLSGVAAQLGLPGADYRNAAPNPMDYMTGQRLLPSFVRYMPDRAASFRQAVDAVARNVQQTKGADTVSKILQPGGADELLEQAQSERNTFLKDLLYTRAAMAALTGGDFDRALSIVEKIGNEDQRSSLNSMIKLQAATAALKKDDLESALRYAAGVSDLRQRAYLYGTIARALFDKNDAVRALAILGDAERDIDKADDDAVKANALLIIAEVKTRIDMEQGFEAAGAAVKAFNRADSAGKDGHAPGGSSALSAILNSTLKLDAANFGPVFLRLAESVGSSRVDLQACKLEYSIVSPK